MFLQTRGVHTFIMHKSELADRLKEIQEKGFDDSFAEFCSDTFSSYEYPKERLAAARMHAFWLRIFIEDYLSGMSLDSNGEYYGDIYRMAIEIGLQVVDWSLGRETSTGDDFCREFVRRWCERCASC